MVQIVDKINVSDPVRGIPKAAKAYVFYETDRETCAVTEHQIKDDRLGAGRVVSLRGLGERFSRLNRTDTPTILPKSVFLSTGKAFAWTTSARLAPMWFSIGSRQWAHRVWWPNLLWIVNRQQRDLQVFAVGRGGRPSIETPIYHAPLMNIGANGTLCEGSAQLPRRLDETQIPQIEACIFDSNFTHINHGKTLKGGADDRQHIAFWREKEQTGQRVRVGEMTRIGRVGERIR